MKRTLTVLCFLLLPLSTWAMTTVSDSELASVTGQAGVSINADVEMDVMMDTMAWGDNDGLNTTVPENPWGLDTNGGYVGVTGFGITNMRVRARTGDSYNGYHSSSMLKSITIDVATDATLHNGRTFVRMGMGSLQITADAMDFNVTLGPTTAVAAFNQVMGTVSIGALGVYINPVSYVDIWSHDGAGVNMGFYVAIDHIDLGYLSWGDSDGVLNIDSEHVGWIVSNDTNPLTHDANAGYIGLSGLNIAEDGVNPAILITGSVSVDVATDSFGIYSHAYGQPMSVVHFVFSDDFTVKTGAITGDVKLGNNAALENDGSTTFAKTLGDIYISGCEINIHDGSWVDIFAH